MFLRHSACSRKDSKTHSTPRILIYVDHRFQVVDVLLQKQALGACRRTRSGFERPFFRLAASGCIDDKTNIACFAVFARRKNCSLSGRRRNSPIGSEHCTGPLQCCISLNSISSCWQLTGIYGVRKPRPTSVGLHFLSCSYLLGAAQ